MKLNPDSLFDEIRHLFFPRRCVLCSKITENLSRATPLCSACRQVWQAALLKPCPECGQITMRCRCLPAALQKEKAAGVKLPQTEFYHLMPYESGNLRAPAVKLLLRLKRQKDADALDFLASQMMPLCECAIAEHRVDAAMDKRNADWIITYTPRSRKASAKNGFDQSAALAKRLSHLLGIPCKQCFRHVRGRNTAQKTLNSAGRLENAGKSYQLYSKIELNGKRVLLVDDILTTGATLSACAGLLLTAGAAACICVTAAKTVLQP